jgi:hypothetical protein
MLRARLQADKIGEHGIEPAELDLVLRRDLAIAAGLQARAEAEGAAPIVAAASPESPSLSGLKRRRSTRSGGKAAAASDAVASIPVCGHGYQFVFRKTSSLLDSTTST